MKKSTAILVVVLAISLLLQSLSLAWISDNGLSSPVDITANVHKNYFAYGNGSVDEPYGIATPVQLYYFSWLQYLGYFNPDDNGDHIIDRPYYFELANDIDMAGIVLPPIGTLDNPFISNFDGQGFTVSNLVIKNLYGPDLTSPPKDAGDSLSGVEIVGFFGVVGSLEGDTSYTYKTEANEVKNLALENVTIVTQTEKSLIGLVAGYVNGTVDCVGVLGGTINIADGVTALTYTENISDYSLIGFCTKEYKDSVYVMDITISQPGVSDSYNVVPDMTSDGESPGWGGSVKMSDIYTWLTDVSEDRTTTNGNYVLERSDVISVDGKTVTLDRENASKLNYSVQNFGSFVITNSQPNYVNFISGGTKVTAIKYSYTENDVAVYYITDGTNYLCYNGTSITNTTNQANATTWYVSNGVNGGNIYTVVEGSVFYLTIANGAITTIEDVDADINNLPMWEVSEGTYSCNGISIECVEEVWQLARLDNVKIQAQDSNNFLDVATNSTTNVGNATTDLDAATWSITSVDGGYTVSTIINNNVYYLGYESENTGGGWFNQATPTRLILEDTFTPTTWQVQNGQIYVPVQSWFNTTNYYVGYLNREWTISNTQSTLKLIGDTDANVDIISSGETAKGIVCNEVEYIDNSTQNRYYDENGNEISTGAGITYFPLSTTVNVGNNSYSIASSNTGYIIGAEWGAIEKNEHDQYGNIRISRYNASDMSNTTMPLTMTYETIKTSTAFQPIDATPTAEHLATLGLQKYADCYMDFRSSVANYCYGLHFMQATVSASNITQFDAYLNGGIKENYQMPTNCIDFNLYDRGFINFVAGSYFTGQGVNDSFFSIYEVVRDENENITEIKEIRKIYAYMKNGQIDTSKAYYYTYRDGNNEVGTEGIPAGYEMAFDCHWITNPNSYSGWANNKAFYFEVPVNAGEYAIGSTEGRTGAYLVYLDLAANAQLVERQKDYEQIVEEKYAGSLPKGVELLAPGETLENGVDPKDSAFVSINAAGEIVFSTTDGVTITHTAKDGTSAEYIGPNNTLLDGNGVAMTMPSERTTIYKTTYRDHNLNTGEYTVTVITETHKSDGTVAYERTITKGTWNSETNAPENMGTPETKKSETEKLYPTTKDTTENQGGGAIGADLVGLYFAYGQKDSLAVKYEYVYDATNPTYNITITVTNEGSEDVDIEDVDVKAVLKSTTSGVTVYINGQELESTTDPQIVTVTVTSGGDATQ